jgi:hypothetical protein
MLWLLVAHPIACVLDLATARRRADGAQDLEIALLRHQLRVLQRQRGRPPLYWLPSSSAA